MIRLGLVYLAIVSLSVGLITGLPFKLFDAEPVAVVADAPVAMAPVQPAADLEQMTAAILADLGADAAPAQAAVAAPDAALAAMSNAALAGLQGLRKPKAAQDVTLQGLVVQALQEGQSDAYIDALVNEAAGAGAVAVPQALMTSEGKVDTAVLLASIVAKAQDVELAEGDAPTFEATATTDPAVAFLQTQDMLYTVEPGDSLGGLALRFYGDSGFYPAIFAANTSTLGAADRIKVGQRLVIPARDKL